MKNGTTAPKRCVKCNAPAHDPPVLLKFAKSDYSGRTRFGSGDDLSKAIGAASAIVGVARAIQGIQRATVTVYVCDAHRLKPRNKVLACVFVGVAVLASIICTVLAMRMEDLLGFTIGGIAAFFVAILSVAILLRAPVRLERSYCGVVWLKGAGQAFLDSLEPWNDGVPK